MGAPAHKPQSPQCWPAGCCLIAMTTPTVATWQCKCGVMVTVVAQINPNNAAQTVIAACPICSDKQWIYASRITAITAEDLEGAVPPRASANSFSGRLQR